MDRRTTCKAICEYCYVANLERIYPTYHTKIVKNANEAKDNPTTFAERLNEEYSRYRKSSLKKMDRLDKLPVRFYGSGDFIPEHLTIYKNLTFKHYIITKNLLRPEYRKYLKEIAAIDNVTNVVLSFDFSNISWYKDFTQYRGIDKYSFAFTGTADDFSSLKSKDFQFDIFFNISNKQVEKDKSKLLKEQCPCDSGSMAHNKSCSYCSKCWRSNITKTKEWNTLNPKQVKT
jgi:hypothetical protein